MKVLYKTKLTMNIHEHQAKKLLKQFGAPVSNGVVVYKLADIKKEVAKLKSKEYVLKAQIHAGGRGKAGGVKLVKNIDELEKEAKDLLGKILVTHQTGPEGKEVKRLYIEEASDIESEFYLSCLVDRESSKIAFISSTEGGMDIEKVATETPKKIITTKVDFGKNIKNSDIEKIIRPFNFESKLRKEANNLVQSLFKILIEKDATLIEINPLIITKQKRLICLDAKMNFDDNAIFRRPDILGLRDLNEENPTEIEASKNDLAYIKLNGSIGCMVNGAGLAMATMDIIKLAGGDPANFLDVGGTASAETVKNGFRIILSDKNVKAVLINIFGGIVRCDRVANGVVQAVKELGLDVPVVVRLEGTNAEAAQTILEDSGVSIIPAKGMKDAAEKVVNAAVGL